MADNTPTSDAPENLEALQSRHRKEQKDLQSRITQKKKNASKKTRKGVNTECEDLERQLKERQTAELAALSGETPDTAPPDLEEDEEEEQVNGVADSLAGTSITSTPAESENGDSSSQQGTGKKRNRAKERLARRAAETAASIETAKAEAASQPDVKALEREKISAQVEEKGLVEKIIRPDGHCLFSAVADQLGQIGVEFGGEGYKVVRGKAAGYMEKNPGEFEGFLEEEIGGYVEKIRDTAEWGGHLELLALSKVYGVEICVVQDGPMQVIEPGEETGTEREKIWLAYYRHGFGLGEHYNSLRKAP